MPWHKNRVWQITDVATPEDLARDVTQHSWTLCTAFRLGEFLFCNDSLSEDSVAEYIVIRERDCAEIESITFGWCDEAKALQHIEAIITMPDPCVFSHANREHLQNKKEHGTCWACA